MHKRDDVIGDSSRLTAEEKKTPKGVRLLLWVFALVFGLYVGNTIFYVIYGHKIQKHYQFPIHKIEPPSGVDDLALDVDKEWVTTSHGKIETWYLPAKGDLSPTPSPTIIFAHGNAELIDHNIALAETLQRTGISVLLVEYPGYGRSKGVPSQEAITEAYVAAYDMLVSRKDVDPTRIALFGKSLGGGVISTLAAQRPSNALILWSTFASFSQRMSSKYFFPRFVIKDPFETIQVVRSYPGKVLVIHGTRDEMFPYSEGMKLYRAAKYGKMITYDCGHTNCPSDTMILLADLVSFLKEAGVLIN
jgi:pimeloyl-ACP methyl ester carboxylesterase